MNTGNIKKINNKFLFLSPLILATTFAFAEWDSSAIKSSEDEERSAFIDLSKMVAAGDVEGIEGKAISAATDQGVGFTQSFLERSTILSFGLQIAIRSDTYLLPSYF